MVWSVVRRRRPSSVVVVHMFEVFVMKMQYTTEKEFQFVTGTKQTNHILQNKMHAQYARNISLEPVGRS